MMIEPPIDKLVEKVGCKYALVCLITKRTRYLLDKKAEMLKYVLEHEGKRPVSVAAAEVDAGKVEARNED
ncbi:MAG: DNA-directed RNA polymerase subunit omega [Clostridiales bacterium]|jgi:DNA-directed RNA polymerase omega subunit|nr:DNA-directed RNA polymerase subunit omega [Clostridiales bacterium]